MTIEVGDHLPDGKFTVMGADGPRAKPVSDVLPARRWRSSPSRRLHADVQQKPHAGLRRARRELKAKGIDVIACTAVNDIFVLTNWAKDTGATGKKRCWPTGSGDLRQGDRPRDRSFELRPRAPIEALRDARRRRRRESLERRGQPADAENRAGQSLLDDRSLTLNRRQKQPMLLT